MDAAIECGIPHGGWVPRGRRTHIPGLRYRYNLIETLNIGYHQSTALNILDSDGTVIFSRGKPVGSAALTLDLSGKHSRSCLYIDFEKVSVLKAAGIVQAWIEARSIQVLNVAGSETDEEDELLYDFVKNILHSLLNPPASEPPPYLPRTLPEALEQLIADLPLKEKTRIARIEETDLNRLFFEKGRQIQVQFGLGTINDELTAACCALSGMPEHSADNAVKVILTALWKRLRQTHMLRHIK